MANTQRKSVEGTPGYAVFFDNIRMDEFIKNWSTTVAIDGSMSSANIEMIYVPEFYRFEGENTSANTTTVELEDGIEDMTNVKIFVKNMFNGKYVMVFDGNIRSCSLTRNPNNGYSLSFMAQDYMTWLNRTIVPLAVPMAEQMPDGDILKWRTYGIDITKIPAATTNQNISFKGKTLTEYINMIKEKTLEINKIYSSADTVSHWDHVTDRFAIMGDIDEQLVHSNIIDFVVTTGATSVNSMYVAINDIAKNLMFEFFQDRDGVLRIKPPYWNETVLYDHIIEPALILNYSEQKNWANRYTRVIATGAIEDYLESDATEQDYIALRAITPVAAYNGVTFSDYTSGDVTRQKNATAKGIYFADNYGVYLTESDVPLPPSSGSFGYMRSASTTPNGVYMDAHKHSGIDIPPRTESTVGGAGYIRHFGWKGILSFRKSSTAGNVGEVRITEGPYKGCVAQYLHMSETFTQLSGEEITNGTVIGIAGSTGHSYSTHLHFQVKDPGGYRDPVAYLRIWCGSTTIDDVVKQENQSVGSVDLLSPTLQEKKYGISVYDVTQSLIKVSTAQAIGSSSVTSALKKYAVYMHNLLNSAVEVANIQTVAMPWIRPGFNVWIDPVFLDKIFYVNAISHHGSAEGGTYTVMSLGLGRSREKCVGVNGSFGRILGNYGHVTDNVFINKISQYPEHFGRVVKSPEEYKNIARECSNFYSKNDDTIVKANKSVYFQNFYGNADYDTKVPSKVISVKVSQKTEDTTVAGTNKASLYHFSSWPAMKINSRGAYVTELQKVLADTGFYKENYYDTKFGSITRTALVSFQKYYGLSQSAVVDAATKSKMQEVLSNLPLSATSQVAASAVTGPSASKSTKLTDNFFAREYTISEIQAQLNYLYSGAPKVVKDRAAKTLKIVKRAKDYIKKHYITDTE